MNWRCCIALIAFCVASASAEENLQPVPARMLQKDRLVIQEGNLSIQLPGGEWKWFREVPSPPTTKAFYIAENSNQSLRILLLVHNLPGTEIQREFVQGVESGAAKGAEKAGKKIEQFHSQMISSPLRGSYRYSYNLAGDIPVYVYGYIFASGSYITLQSVTPESVEPAALSAAAASIKLLKPVQRSEDVKRPPGSSVYQYVLPVLLTLGICWIINRFKPKNPVNAWRVCAAVAGFILVLKLALVTIRIMRVSPEPFEAGRLFGEEMGAGAIALAICLIASRQKKNKVVSPSPQPGGSMYITRNK